MDDPPGSATIVDIRGNRGRMRLVRLSDGRELLFSSEACDRARIAPRDTVTPQLLEVLDGAEQRGNAHQAALRLLSHRSRSEDEMRTRLRMRGIEPQSIDDEIARLKESGLIDDAKFARSWVEDRSRTSPRGRRMLRYELLGRGVAPEAVDEATAEVDDLAAAVELARSRARGAVLADYDVFITKVGGVLRRRGFGYDVLMAAARQVWVEVTGRQPGENEVIGMDGLDEDDEIGGS